MLGLCLFLLLLETGLRVGGFVLLSMQEYRNRASLRQKSTCRILCLGESTTLNQYPALLEKELNKLTRKIKFSVIDKGISGANTSVILAQLESNLDKYRPEIVVTMMGINDGYPSQPPGFFTHPDDPRFFETFRTHKLAMLLWAHMKAKAAGERKPLVTEPAAGPLPDNIPVKAIDEKGLCDTAQAYQKSGKLSQAEEAFKEVLNINPDNLQANIGLGLNYRLQREESKAVGFYLKAIELDPQNVQALIGLGITYRFKNKTAEAQDCFRRALELAPDNPEALMWMGIVSRLNGNFTESEQYLLKSLQINPRNDEAYIALGMTYRLQNRLSAMEKSFLKAVEANPKNSKAYINLAQFHQRVGNFYAAEAYYLDALTYDKNSYWPYAGLAFLYQCQGEMQRAEAVFEQYAQRAPSWDDKAYGALSLIYEIMDDPQKAEEYEEKAEEIRNSYYNLSTVKNYRKLKSILDERGIRHVCVQYPMRSIERLQKIFSGEADIVFVNNKEIFEEAVKAEGMRAYFNDIFAGDFGHCTAKGNQLLARNIAEVIMRELFGE